MAKHYETNTIGLRNGSLAGRQKLQNGKLDKKNPTGQYYQIPYRVSKALAVNHSKKKPRDCDFFFASFCIAFLHLILQYHESNHYSPSC